MSAYSYTSKGGKEKIAKILNALQTPMTRCELEKHFFISLESAKLYLKHLRDIKDVYISGWRRELEGETRGLRPIYSAGKGRNKPMPKEKIFKKPKPIIKKQKPSIPKSTQYYQKLKQDPERYFLYLKKKSHSRKMAKFIPQRDPLVSFLFPL